MNPKISIIIPVYNSAATIEHCVASIFKQDFYDFEVLLIDDGSTDQSGMICEGIVQEYTKKKYSVRVIHQENKGLSGARNTGIQLAQGDYLCFIDSDDSVEPNYLSCLLDSADINTLSVCGMKFICNDKITISTFPQSVKYDDPYNNEDFLKLFECGLINSACNKLYSTKKIRENHLLFKKIAIAEDIAFNIDYINRIKSVVVTTESPYRYIKDNSTLTTRVSSEMFDNYINLHKKMYELVSKGHHSLIDRFIFHQYFSFMLKYLQKVTVGECSAKETYQLLSIYHNNNFVRYAFASYRPVSKGEYLLYLPARLGCFRLMRLIQTML